MYTCMWWWWWRCSARGQVRRCFSVTPDLQHLVLCPKAGSPAVLFSHSWPTAPETREWSERRWFPVAFLCRQWALTACPGPHMQVIDPHAVQAHLVASVRSPAGLRTRDLVGCEPACYHFGHTAALYIYIYTHIYRVCECARWFSSIICLSM